MTAEPAISTSGLVKRFGDVIALSAVAAAAVVAGLRAFHRRDLDMT